MRLVHQIGLALVVAAVAPLLSAGFAVIAANERALEAEVKARLDQTAAHAAVAVAADVEGRAKLLAESAAMIRWGALDGAEREGALAILKRQAGARRARFVADGADEASEPGAPIARARREGVGAVVIGAPRVDERGEPEAIVALAVEGGVLTLALPLGGEARRLAEVRAGDPGVGLFLVDDAGRTLLSSAGGEAGRAAAPAPAVMRELQAGGDGRARRFVDGETSLVAAFAPVGGLGWAIIVEQESARAFAAPRRMRLTTLAVTVGGALLAVGLALLLARRLSAALERLAAAARALGRGDARARVAVPEGASTADEIASVGRTFNTMADELMQKRAELEAFSRELEARVEARTRELKEAQAQLVEAQKLAALGQLGAGVAHEINNPLGGVLGHVQLLLADKGADHPDAEALRCIDEAARKASHVVQNLLRFSVQHEKPVKTTVDLNKLVDDTLSLTRALLDERGVAVVLELAQPPPRARADRGQLAQVLLNLVSNARTAMPSGGTLTIGTRSDGSEVALVVKDTGKGMTPETKARIFEPFFTTKDEWSNVGLGLSVSWRIVEEHGGRIAVESAPGAGATFTVYLPA
jgi:signal transduction histidine kinase